MMRTDSLSRPSLYALDMRERVISLKTQAAHSKREHSDSESAPRTDRSDP